MSRNTKRAMAPVNVMLWLLTTVAYLHVTVVQSYVVDDVGALLEHLSVNKMGYRMPEIDPEVNMNISQLITSKGYPYEEYSVQTEDGYLLGVQRIPHGVTNKDPNRPVVFLQHGLLCSATNFLTNLASESLAYILADAGFDVWLGNNRGNTYSLRHVSLKPDQDAFWEFSWDEFAKYDFPAQLNFALKQSGQSDLYYVGHSQGTLQAFAALSQYPEMNKKVKKFFAMGPVVTVGNIISPLKYLSDISDSEIYKLFKHRDFLPHDEILQLLADTVCQDKHTRFLCSNVLFLIAGYDVSNLNQSRLPVYISHTPAGTSVQDMVHFAQGVRTKAFQMYDYGSETDNQKHYNQSTPPLYDVNKMDTPVYLFYSENDWLADVQDVKLLMSKLTRGQLQGSFYIPKWNHLDFIWGVDAVNVVYKKIIDIIKTP
ncbi:lysosomal acid lipase/cholesteryl ester hydrolase-like [Haliotis rufescens]|uniref:lysosomal acid lipase/cholesteryl ester hydrolase-like n=1 Tax=Haliotis rufescens TaxID=6454 RepID=UPI00201EF122|nr:lysosomal acid lipase/cholesteryl ester hydrolase-like [Haliotis rufescens]